MNRLHTGLLLPEFPNIIFSGYVGQKDLFRSCAHIIPCFKKGLPLYSEFSIFRLSVTFLKGELKLSMIDDIALEKLQKRRAGVFLIDVPSPQIKLFRYVTGKIEKKCFGVILSLKCFKKTPQPN